MTRHDASSFGTSELKLCGAANHKFLQLIFLVGVFFFPPKNYNERLPLKKIDGWKMIFFFWNGPFSGDMLISEGGVGN